MLAGFGLASWHPRRKDRRRRIPLPSPRWRDARLSHDESLKWIDEHKAWKLARKTRPIWARPVEPDEDGKEFQTADHVKQVARQDSWLCVGGSGEPWFHALDKIEGKYEPSGEEVKSFRFDTESRTYKIFKPRVDVKNWVAQVKGPGIEGFFIKPGYDPERPTLFARRRVRGQGPCGRPLPRQSQGRLARAAAALREHLLPRPGSGREGR